MGQLLPFADSAGLFLSMNEAQKFSEKKLKCSVHILHDYCQYRAVIFISCCIQWARDSPDAAQETLSVSCISVHLPAVCWASIPLPSDLGSLTQRPLRFHPLSWNSCSVWGESMRLIFLSLVSLQQITRPSRDVASLPGNWE